MKKIIFVGSQSFPFAAIAAAIRVGMLPADRLPDLHQLRQLPFMDNKGRQGSLLEIGTDTGGNRVYAVWDKSDYLLKNIIETFLEIYHIPRGTCEIIEVTNPEPYLLRLALSLGRWPFFANRFYQAGLAGIELSLSTPIRPGSNLTKDGNC